MFFYGVKKGRLDFSGRPAAKKFHLFDEANRPEVARLFLREQIDGIVPTTMPSSLDSLSNDQPTPARSFRAQQIPRSAVSMLTARFPASNATFARSHFLTVRFRRRAIPKFCGPM
jgi:hypothetical protein